MPTVKGWRWSIGVWGGWAGEFGAHSGVASLSEVGEEAERTISMPF